MGPVQYPAKNEEINGIVSYQNFPYHFALQCADVDHKWVTSGFSYSKNLYKYGVM